MLSYMRNTDFVLWTKKQTLEEPKSSLKVTQLVKGRNEARREAQIQSLRSSSRSYLTHATLGINDRLQKRLPRIPIKVRKATTAGDRSPVPGMEIPPFWGWLARIPGERGHFPSPNAEA